MYVMYISDFIHVHDEKITICIYISMDHMCICIYKDMHVCLP